MQKRWSRIFALAMAIPLLLAVLAACGAGTTGGNTGGNTSGPIIIKIGSDFPTSGADESAGKPAENGAHLAVDEANANHTIPNVNFVFVAKNDVGASGTHDGATGQKNVTDLIGDAQVAGIVGPLNSSVAISELPVANTAPIAIISPANTNDCLTQAASGGCDPNQLKTYRPTGKVTYFRIATRDFYQGGALADFGFKTKGYKKVYIIDDTETYGVGIAKAFENEWNKLGGTVIAHKSAPKTTSYVNLLTQAATTNPDLIFFGGNDSTGGTDIRQQMMQVPALKNTPFIAGDGTQTSAFAKTIKPLGGGPVFTSVAAVDITKQGGVAQDFISKYNATYGANNISSYSGGAYDCAKIIIQAIKKAMDGGVKPPTDANDAAGAKTFRQAVIDAIQGIDYTGVTGHHTFDQNGDTTNRVITIKTIGDVNVGDGWTYVSQVNIGQ